MIIKNEWKTRRFLPQEAWTLRKGPKGRNLCRWCEKEVEPPKVTFCSDPCIHQWKLRTSSTYVREHVFERDQGMCAKCGIDAHRFSEWTDDQLRKLKDLPENVSCRSLWEADHVVPVSEGGGCAGLENYVTLCYWCHQEKTTLARKAKSGKVQKR